MTHPGHLVRRRDTFASPSGDGAGRVDAQKGLDATDGPVSACRDTPPVLKHSNGFLWPLSADSVASQLESIVAVAQSAYPAPTRVHELSARDAVDAARGVAPDNRASPLS